MMLDAIIVVIILLPIVLLVIFQRKKAPEAPWPELLYRIAGRSLLVFGILMLFPAFYMLFHGRNGGLKAGLLAVSLLFVFGGYLMTQRSDRKPKAE